MVQAETVFEGRASLTQPAAPACAMPEGAWPLSVPIFADATLREGDIVAMADGFRVFVGRGGPPYDDADFVEHGPPPHGARPARHDGYEGGALNETAKRMFIAINRR